MKLYKFKKNYKKIKRFIINRLLNPIIFRREKIEKIAKKFILNKPLITYNDLWLDGIFLNKGVVYIRNNNNLHDFVTGWLDLSKNTIYLCSKNIKINSKDFNSAFEIIVTDIEWKVIEIHNNIKPENNVMFDFSDDNKIMYFWIAREGFSNFYKIYKGSKLSTKYRSSDFEFFN